MSQSAFLNAPSPSGRRPFVKMHGLRNHFVIIDQRGSTDDVSAADIIRICDVHEGVGAEQVLTIERPSPACKAPGAHARMRIFNIDGREVGACGNATRCMAHLLFEETGLDSLWLETAGGLLHCTKAGATDVRVTLGPISMEWNAIPLSRPADTRHLPLASGPLHDGLALNIGNPHAVFFVGRLADVDIACFAPAIQNDPLFAEGANVGVAEVVDGHTLRLAVWERPGILTEACGTGACVTAYAARLRGLVATDDIVVELPAGSLRIRLLDDSIVEMTGPVAYCCHGYV